MILTALVRSGPNTFATAANRCAAMTRRAMSSARSDSIVSRASSSLVMTIGVDNVAADGGGGDCDEVAVAVVAVIPTVPSASVETGVGAAVGGGPSSMGSISMGS